MDTLDEQRDQAEANLTGIAKTLYSAPESGEKLAGIYTRNSALTNTVYRSFAVTVGDVILGLVPQEKLPDLLIERLHIPKTDAFRITADVLDFLAPLNGETVSSSATDTSARSSETVVRTNQPPQPTASPNPNPQLAAEIAAAEAALHAVQPLRTMAHDMASTKTFQTPTRTQPTQATAAAPSDLIQTPADPNQLVAKGPGNQVRNETATWSES